MLFSRREVAEFLNAKFEPVWVSLRPVPTVTIDFGNGHTITRTLHGNVATYVCDADETVYDVLPGIYTPAVYRQQLDLLVALVARIRTLPVEQQVLALREYHSQRAAALNRPVSPSTAAVAQTGGVGKGGIGGAGVAFAQGGLGGNPLGALSGQFGIKGGQGGFGGTLGQGATPQWPLFPNGGGIEGPLEAVLAGRPYVPPTPPDGDLATRADLVFDTHVNETVRRKLIHERLLTMSSVRPDDIKGWLFKDVLKTDLDDPMLGLGPILNANYPFLDEEGRSSGR